MKRVFIGIDPGTKTGLAVWNSDEMKFEQVATCGIIEAMETVETLVKSSDFKLERVIIEDARKRKWLGENADAKAQGAGSIKRDCSIWEEFFGKLGIGVCFRPPAKNMTKLDRAEFCKLTGWYYNCDSHARDAAMLVFQRNNIPSDDDFVVKQSSNNSSRLQNIGRKDKQGAGKKVEPDYSRHFYR